MNVQGISLGGTKVPVGDKYYNDCLVVSVPLALLN